MFTASKPLSRTRHGLVAMAFLVFAVGGSSLWSHHQSRQQLRAIPTEERQVLYKRTLATLESLCVNAQGSEITEYCREQAQFIAAFPECDATCEGVCRRLAPRPTK